jgi:hypothetical protein
VCDILTAGALEQIHRWFGREVRDLRGYSEDPQRTLRSNKPLVIDQSGFVKEARGSFWDLTTEQLSLMWRHLSCTPRLNASAILAAAGADYPDKELLDGVAHGVRMPADDQMLIVLNPGLLSLAGHLWTYGADITRMEADGMLLVCLFLPYVQCVLLPQGTFGKAHDEEARRRITDAGAPRAPLVARDGTVVISINDAVRLPDKDGQPKIQSEDKPGVADNVNDSGVLAALAVAMRRDGFAPHEYQAYFACDNFKAFFNQFSLHPSEWSRFCLAFLRDGDIYVAAELVLGFGCAPSSGIAQRFAHLVRQVVSERMAAEDAPFVADLRSRAGLHVSAWFAHRDALTAVTGIEQALLFFISIYTDDSCESVVGCARMLRFLRNWTWTCLEFGILCAAAHKRSLGTHVISLGVILCHILRGVFIPVAKVISASADLTEVRSRAPIPFWRCRKVFCLVGHFNDALGLPRSTSYGMYDDFREGCKDSNALIRPSAATAAACDRWLVILQSRIFGSFSPADHSGRTARRGLTSAPWRHSRIPPHGFGCAARG